MSIPAVTQIGVALDGFKFSDGFTGQRILTSLLNFSLVVSDRDTAGEK